LIVEAKSIVDQPDAEAGEGGGAARDAYRQRSYALWQQMADRWERGREVLWETTRPVSERLVQRLSPQEGETILELAAGAGETGFLAAYRLGDHGRLISSDFAPRMVEAARRVADELGITNAEFRVLDAERLELENASVDGAICRFGFMLMADPARALREARRVIRGGGRLAFSVFGEPESNPWMTLARGVMVERGHLSPPDPAEPGLFSLSDPDEIKTLLAEAGFAQGVVEQMEIGFRFGDGASLWAYVSELQGPIALAIAKLDDEERQAVRAAIEDGYAAFCENGGYRLPGLVINVLAS
jgi:ubiquinone/menaquinone biosynthesis C-methylase UbiE